MTKAELVEEIVTETGQSQAVVEQVLESTICQITEHLGGDETVLHLGPLGTFSLREEEAHVGSDPNTHEPTDYPAYTRVLFHPAPTLHDAVQSS